MIARHTAIRGIEERNLLAERWSGLPVYVVRRLVEARGLPRGVERADLAQIGQIALLRAAELWNADRGVKFPTYAYRCVAFVVLRAMTKHGGETFATIPFEEMIPDRPERLSAEELREMHDVLDRLDPADRNLLHLRFLDKRTCRELGEAAGVTKQGMAHRVEKALQRAREVVGV